MILEVRILNELLGHFVEVRIVKDLALKRRLNCCDGLWNEKCGIVCRCSRIRVVLSTEYFTIQVSVVKGNFALLPTTGIEIDIGWWDSRVSVLLGQEILPKLDLEVVRPGAQPCCTPTRFSERGRGATSTVR